ncbi:NADP-dependent oxidoreductase domain-containing protein [Calycina marina]|uniref:NADP-dependent oxidoreductase domain-containing protein n=1 Tax=Calycina marina TaxID=1763456 RepID=A0A9P7Z4L1_9HELO|nr:NADP-dependent oxidoreductase domain-containing protein [Calycina marina]
MSLVQPVKNFSLASKKKLRDKHLMPRIHLGLYQTSGRETSEAVTAALEAGYRGFDSAEWYGNEEAAGRAIGRFIENNTQGVKREHIWFTTKLKTNSTYDETKEAIEDSIERSGLGYLDLYLLHSPYGGPEARAECWKAVEDAIEERLIRSGGVSNFGLKHMKEFIQSNPRYMPSVNQIEVHPFNTRPELVEYCKSYGVTIEAYAPLAKGMRMKDPTILSLSKHYGCTPAQLMIRWSLQHGYMPLPKSTKKERIISNAQIGSFEITDADMETMDNLDEYLITDWDPTDCE